MSLKKYVLLELARWAAQEPHMARRFKRIGLALAALSLVVIVAVGWAGYWALTSITHTISSQVSKADLDVGLPTKLISPECQKAAGALLTLDTWANQPLSSTFQKLRHGCWFEAQSQTI